MLYAFRLPGDQTIHIRNPANGVVKTVNEITPTEGPGANDALATYNQLLASGQCKPWLEIGWNANWALAVLDGRV